MPTALTAVRVRVQCGRSTALQLRQVREGGAAEGRCAPTSANEGNV